MRRVPICIASIDVDRRETLLDGRGLVLTDRLADKLGAARRRHGARRGARGTRAHARHARRRHGARDDGPERLHGSRARSTALLGDGDVSTGFVLAVERGAEAQVLEASKALPRAAGAWSKATMLRNMEEISARNVRIMSTILTVFASVDRGRRGLQQRAHRAGRAGLGAGQPARARLHPRRGLGAAAGRARARHRASPCRSAWCSAGR